MSPKESVSEHSQRQFSYLLFKFCLESAHLILRLAQVSASLLLRNMFHCCLNHLLGILGAQTTFPFGPAVESVDDTLIGCISNFSQSVLWFIKRIVWLTYVIRGNNCLKPCKSLSRKPANVSDQVFGRIWVESGS